MLRKLSNEKLLELFRQRYGSYKKKQLERVAYQLIVRLLYYSSFVGIPLNVPGGSLPHKKKPVVRCMKKSFWGEFMVATITVTEMFKQTDVGFVHMGEFAIRAVTHGFPGMPTSTFTLNSVVGKNGCLLQCKSIDDMQLYKCRKMMGDRYGWPNTVDVSFYKSMHTDLYGHVFDFYAIIIRVLSVRLYALLDVYCKRFVMPKPRRPEVMRFKIGRFL